MPQSLRRKGLSYSWVCPEGIEALCQDQTSPVLSIPWEKVIENNVPFATDYTIKLIINWSKTDGTLETKTESSTVAWFDVEMPVYDLTYTPDPVLVTYTKNTVFTITPSNFEVTDMRNY